MAAFGGVGSPPYTEWMAVLRLFASVRQAAGTGRANVSGATVGDVVAEACDRYGGEFTSLVPTCRVWLNGDPARDVDPVGDSDEVALLPPVSGG